MKKEQEAHRELSQSLNISGKRELRKRAMSTSVRDHSFEPPTKREIESPPEFILPTKSSNDSITPIKNRRMSVFVPSSKQMYTPPIVAPRSPVYKPPPIKTHKSAGMALKFALKAVDQNKASLFDPKYIQIENFRQREMSFEGLGKRSEMTAATSILQKLSGGLFSKTKVEESPVEASNDQISKRHEKFNFESELDISKSSAINLDSDTKPKNLMQLALSEAKGDMCVLQECSADSADLNENAADSDSEPKLEIHHAVLKKPRGRPRKNPIGKQSVKGQARLTVMQRLQENKIRKSREQLFQRLLKHQNEEGEAEDDDQESSDSSHTEND